MRTIAVLTTAAVMALSVASAQNAAPTAAPAASPAGSDPVQTALGAYAAYQVDVTQLRAARLQNADALESAIDTASHHNRDALSRGWIAYGAMTAAQSPAFVQGVRQAAAYYGRDAVLWAITADTSYARGLRGGDEAVRLALDAANADGARVIAVADRYQEMAYSLQRQRWASAVAPGQSARVQRVRSLSAAGSGLNPHAEVGPRLAVSAASFSPSSDPSVFGGRAFWDSIGGRGAVTQASSGAGAHWRVDGPRGEAVNRMTSIAAIEALGARTERASAVDTLLSEQRSKDCIEMAQLQLYQCMSAAHFRYENAFCLGQHALRDVGQCFSAVARPDVAATAMTPVPAAR